MPYRIDSQCAASRAPSSRQDSRPIDLGEEIEQLPL
jgi:hypothetical protein